MVDNIKISQFYCERRKRLFEKKKKRHRISVICRRILHPVLLKLIKLDRRLSHEKLIVLNGTKEMKNNVIYACTHIGGNDVQRVFEAIHQHAFLLLGDPNSLYYNLLGGIIFLNGAIYLETRDKLDRKIAEFRTNELLEMGGSILIFPEGAWNIEPSLPVMKMFPGVVRMARKTGCDIIPVAVEVYDDTYYVNFGDGFTCRDAQISDKEYLNRLRDIMASLKWEIFETQEVTERNKIKFMSDMEYANMVISRVDWGYTIEDVLETRFRDQMSRGE